MPAARIEVYQYLLPCRGESSGTNRAALVGHASPARTDVGWLASSKAPGPLTPEQPGRCAGRRCPMTRNVADIHAGMDVYAMDGKKLGCVTRVWVDVEVGPT